MEQPVNSRMRQLEQLLERSPTDPFLLYGIALEHKKLKDLPHALEYLERTIAADPGYAYAYFQRGQVYEMTGDLAAARASYLAGIDAAAKKGDAHARSELEGALSMIE